MRSDYASRLRIPLDIAVIVLLVVVGVYLLLSPGSHWLGLVSIGVAAIFVIMLLAAFLLIPPLAFRHDPKLRDEYSLTFSGDGIHFRTAQIDSQLQWTIYSRALVDPYSYVLYYGSRSFTVIPKRVFQSVEQQEAFDQLIADRIPQVVRKYKK